MTLLVRFILLKLLCGSCLTQARLASVGQANHRALETAFDCNALNCDDGNSLTMDTCDPSNGCHHVCDDGNACTREAIVDGICQYVDENDSPYDCSNDNGLDCIPGLIDCSDNNLFTTDVCVPSTGCRHFDFLQYVGNLLGLDNTLKELEAEETIFYEEQSSLTDDQVVQVLDWIKLEVSQLRTPFCWRRSYGRGVGEPIQFCPPGKERIGALCYSPCKPGFSRQGTLDCHQNCKDGWRDDGLFCRLAEYGRGVGYPWKFGDPLNDSKMFQRCEADHGGGKCEKHGLIVYPKCRPGYSSFGCCICRPSFQSCEAEGYTNIRLDLSCLAKIELGDPTPLVCREGLEQDGLLCYPPCDPGYNGLGPVCWQQCDVDQTWCAAGCARDVGDCIFALTDQLISPAIAAANLATLGANTVPSAASGTAIQIAGVLYEFATFAGQVMGWLAATLDVIDPDQAPKNAKVVNFNVNTGNIVLDGAISATLFGAEAIMSRQFAQDFVAQTSPEIAQAIAVNLDPRDALYIQRAWADVQFWELASIEGWNFASFVLNTFAVFDITGITNVLAAYLKPICLEIFPFPVCNSPSCRSSVLSLSAATEKHYETDCQDVQVFANVEGNCEALVDPISVDGGSLSPDHEKIFLLLEPEGPFPVQDSPQSVTLTATDSNDNTKSCTASITVIDETPASIVCPVGKSQNNDPGVCGAAVDYTLPQLTANCHWESSTLLQTTGLPSGSLFDVGSTANTFQVTDSLLGTAKECSFAIGVFDTEAPEISCADLATSVSTEPGTCVATYVYQAPVGQDNCEASTVMTQSPSLDPHSFPLGSNTVEYTATDLEGNTASCSFVVDVLDEESPSASCDSKDGVFTISGTDNCNSPLKAYVIDSASGVRFPTEESGLDYYEVGTTFEYKTVGSGAPAMEKAGNGPDEIQWKLFGQGQANVVIEDASGNESLWAPCV